MSYSDKLKDPRWQKRRLQVMERDGWRCQHCHSATKTLAVHHVQYHDYADPWDYSDADLLTLCTDCHHAGHFDPTLCCAFCQQTITDANYGGSTEDGKMNDAARGHGLCTTCAALLDLAR